MKRKKEVIPNFPRKRSHTDESHDCYDIQKPCLSFGKRGSVCSLFNPVGLAIHPSGLIFIGENTYLSPPFIHTFSSEGDYITSFGKGYLSSICDITVDEFNIYVSNPSLSVLVRFTDFRTQTKTFPLSTSPFPTGIVCNIDGYLYLVDSHNKTVHVYNSRMCLSRIVRLNIDAIPIRLSFLSDIMVIFCINPTAILYCTMDGDHLRFLAHFDDILSYSRHFCVDTRTNNTFMSDQHQNQNRIMVFNIEGKLIKIILPIRNDLCVPLTSMAITPQNRLVVITPHGSSTVQLYHIDL